MDSGVQRESKGSESWPAWAGNTDRLARLAKAISDATAGYTSRAVEEDEIRIRSSYDFLSDEDLEKKVEEVRAAAEDEWGIKMQASRREFSTKYSGSPIEVLNAIDPKTIRALEITWPKYSVYAKAAIGIRLSAEKGCRFEINGDDPDWVRAAHGSITDELKQGVPWWSVFRRVPMAIGAAALVWIAIFVWIASAGGTGGPASYLGFLLGPFAFAFDWLFKRLLPGFEILTPEDKGKGGRVVAIFGALLIGIAGSIIASLLLN